MSLKNRKSSQDNVSLDGPGPAGVRRSISLLSTKKLLNQSLEASELEASQLNYSTGSKTSPSSKRQTNQSRSLDTAELEALRQKYSFSSKMLPREQNIAEDDLERSDGFVNNHAFLKYNKTFHRLFSDIPERECLIHVFTCSLQKEVLYHGKLFVSDSHLCFYSSVLLKETKVVIPVSSVRDLKKHNSALSMLSVTTSSGEKYLFVSLRNLKFRFKLLQNICSQSQEESGNSSPQLSSVEIDGGRDTISSSSSFEGSIEQDSCSIDLGTNIFQMMGEVPGTSSSLYQSSLPEEDHSAVSLVWKVTEKVKPSFFRDIKNCSLLFYIYILLLLLLLLVSGYMGLRITALEEQLSSLGALSDLSREFQET